MENKENYLFPFGRVPKGSRIIIYGAGKKGQVYLQQVLETNYSTVLCMADRNAELYENAVIPVIVPDQIHEQNFDYVVLAARSSKTRQIFHSVLHAQGIAEARIVDGSEDEQLGLRRLLRDEGTKTPKRLLFFVLGGIGDCVVHKKIVEILISMDPEIQIDIDCVLWEPFLRFLYQETPQVRQIRTVPKTVYDLEMQRYQAALFFNGSGWVRVDWLQQPNGLSKQLASSLTCLQEKGIEEPFDEAIPAFVYYQRGRFRGENCYQHLGAGILPVDDRPIQIPSVAADRAAFEDMHLGRYVTVNYGNGSSEDIRSVAKSWPIERFEQLIPMIHATYPELEILQLGAKGAHPLAGADRCVLGGSFGLVREVLQHSLLHIDIEGGLVHFASQMGTKCLVLFGPTLLGFNGYPHNTNLLVSGCRGCYHLDPKHFNACARGLEEPECMYSITPEMVMEAVKSYFSSCSALS